eukprot:gene4969-5210_t
MLALYCSNAKKQADLGELSLYLNQVSETMTSFEVRLWSMARDYHQLAQQQPRQLVDVARVVEMQEQMDVHYITTKATYVRPKHFKERLLLEMEAGVAKRFAPLLALCNSHDKPNCKVKYDQQGNTVLSESRDYLGALIDVERCDPNGRRLRGATDAELAVMQELVHLPVAPLSANAEDLPGFAVLINSYTDRMETTMVAWFKAILQQSLDFAEHVQGLLEEGFRSELDVEDTCRCVVIVKAQ